MRCVTRSRRPASCCRRPRWRALPALVLAALVGLALAGCEDKLQLARAEAPPLVERLAPLVARDTKQVREGLPVGAQKLGRFVDEDPGADLAALQRAIQRARADVESLAFAKSTFFVFVDKGGTVLRSEADPDLAAGQSLYEAVPETSKLSVAGTGLLEAFGALPGLRGVQHGPDLQWIVGHPVKSGKGEPVGSLVTGWSLRKYAHYLEEDTRRYLVKSQGEKMKSIPLVYVFVVRGTQAFGAPVTPEVNAEAVGKLDVLAKAAGGLYQATINVEGRDFVLVAKAFAELGPGLGIAVLYSSV